ncbi:putative reverse transcriptase domain-containing protein, partial [Tanacetum coccineum]
FELVPLSLLVSRDVILSTVRSSTKHNLTALRRPYALSWKPCQGDSLNLPDHRIHKDGDGDASFQLKSDSLPHAHAQTTKNSYRHQDSRIKKGHFKKDCLKLKNGNGGNQRGNGNSLAEVYVMGNAGTNPDSNVVMELGSFDVIIGMDWLAKYDAVIDCAEKIVRIPWVNETLIVHGNGSSQGNETRLNIISCTKTHKYLLKGHHVFLAHVTIKETEDKSREKRLEDVPIVRDFPEVLPEDLPSLPLTRQG